MQFIIATTKSGAYRLQVFNRGFRVGTHVSSGRHARHYLKMVIRGYTDRMARPSHAGHGHPVHVIWA